MAVIAVMGATGAQGGAVVDALLQDGEFEVRGISRNPDSEKAGKLLAKGVKEVVQGNADDLESMTKAFQGAYGAYVVTNFWEDMDMDHEMEQMRKLAKAAKAANVRHVVLSTLEDTRDHITGETASKWKVINEKHKSFVPHFDGKGEVTKEFVNMVPTTTFYTSFYYENFIHFGMGPKKHDPSQPKSITFPMGDTKLMMNSVADIGRMAAKLFKDSSTIGTTQGVMSTALTLNEVADVFTQILGENVVYNAVDTDTYAKFGFPGANDLANMFRFFQDFESVMVKNRDMDKINKFLPQLDSFEAWLHNNKSAFA